MKPEDREKATTYLHSLQRGWLAHPAHDARNLTADLADALFTIGSAHVFAGDEGLSEAVKAEQLKLLTAAMHAAFAQRTSEFDDPVVSSLLDEIAGDIEQTEAAAGRDLPLRPVLGTLPSGDLNAITIAVPDSDVHVVALQHGTIGFVDFGFRAVFAALPTPTQSVFETVGASLDDVRAVLLADPQPVLDMTSFVSNYVFQGSPYGCLYEPLVGAKARMHTFTRHVAEAFIIGHEYGHLHLGHLARGETGQRFFGPHRAKVRMQAQGDEFEADSFGFGLALSMSRHVLRLPTVLGYLAVDLLFSLMGLVERCLSIATAGAWQPSSSHPSTQTRQLLLRMQLASLWPDQAVAHQVLEAACGMSRVVSLLGGPAEHMVEQLASAGMSPAAIWNTQQS